MLRDWGRGRIRVCLGLHEAVRMDSVESEGWNWGWEAELGRRTVAFNLPIYALDYPTEIRPFGKVLEVEADVVGFGEVVEVRGGDFQEVGRAHGPDC